LHNPIAAEIGEAYDALFRLHRKWCKPFTQEYTILFERDDYGGWIFGFSPCRQRLNQ
jgi:transcriptional antiterminator